MRARLTLYLMVSIGGLLAAAAIALAAIIPSWLRSQFDDALETRARALVSLTQEIEGEVDLEFSDQFMPEFQDDEDPYYFEVWVDGQELERSRSFYPERGTRLPDLEREPGYEDLTRLITVLLPDGRPGRQVRIDFVPEVTEEGDEDDADEDEPYEVDEPPKSVVAAAETGEGHVATVIVAGSTEELDGQIAWMRFLTVLVTLVLLGVLAVCVRVAIGLGLRPLRRVMEQVGTMDAQSLARRLDTEEAAVELAPLLETFNHLLDRIERAFHRERRLTADIAHELKTPIAELRSLGEVGERWPEDRDAVVKFFGDAREIALQMERVVIHLLALARRDAGREVIEESVVGLRKLIDRSWAHHADAAAQMGLEASIEVDPDLQVLTDASKLELIVSNLLSNAVRYSVPGTAVRCSASADNGRIRVLFENRPANLDPSDLELMFDRFWRKDAARTGGRSAGLGLSLVREFADILGIEVQASLAADGVFRITLVMPRAPAHPHEAASTTLVQGAALPD